MEEYRKLKLEEADRIAEIDATNHIKNAWRIDAATGEYRLVEINWTDNELPNGFGWHLKRFKETVKNGGTAFGCFEDETLIGYGTVDKELFGKQAKEYGAEKVFLCAGSSENTIAFYKKLGCVLPAAERNQRLYEEDPRDIQLEFSLKGN